MLFFMILMVLALSKAKAGVCLPSLNMICSPNGMVCAGGSFNLTCRFTGLCASQSVQILRDEQMFSEFQPSSSSPASKHNGSLYLSIHKITEADSGQYSCQSNPPYSIAGCPLNVTVCSKTTKNMTQNSLPAQDPLSPLCSKTTKNMTQNPLRVQDPLSPWTLQNTLMWYLLCKTGVFLMCFMKVALKSTVNIH